MPFTPFTPFTRDSHKRVLSFVSLSKEKHFKERYSAKKRRDVFGKFVQEIREFVQKTQESCWQ